MSWFRRKRQGSPPSEEEFVEAVRLDVIEALRSAVEGRTFTGSVRGWGYHCVITQQSIAVSLDIEWKDLP